MPGVPPDAVDTLKRAFKGLFKRGKKKNNKQEQETSPQEQQSPPTTSSAAGEPTTTIATTTSAAPPQLPPVKNPSPLQSPSAEDDLSKPLPPTHPLVTGPHTQPQDAAVPQNHDDAEPGPPPPPSSTGAALTPMDTADFMRERKKKTAQLDSAATADDVGPAIQTSDPRAAPQTTAQHMGVVAANNEDENGVLDTQAAAEKSDSSAVGAVKGEEQAVTYASSSSKEENTQPLPPSTNGIPTASEEEKVPPLTALQTDPPPPPIKAVQAAPGMSATSGPLEDFPEGGVLHDYEEHHSSSS